MQRERFTFRQFTDYVVIYCNGRQHLVVTERVPGAAVDLIEKLGAVPE